MSAPAYSVPSRFASLPVGLRQPSPETLFTVALSCLLTAVALAGGGGLSLGPTTRVEMALQIGGGALGALALAIGPRRRLHGGAALALFGVLAALTIASIGWAVQPADAWLESARTLAYLAVFGGGIALVRMAPDRWASLLSAVLLTSVVVSGYALATKVFPGSLAPQETYARLREPFGYWNAVGLMAAFGVPGCLWLGARRSGHAAVNALACPALGLLFVTILLAYSRGSLLAVGVGVSLWFVVVPLRLRAVAVLAPALGAGLMVAAWAFSQDALSKDRVPLDLRGTAGHELGLAIVAMLVGLLATSLALSFFSSRRALSAQTRRRAGITILVVVALVPVAFAARLTASDRGLGGSISHSWSQLTDPNALTPANDPGRLTAVGSVRATYYDQSLKIYRSREWYGAGAGGFATARARYRKDGYVVRHAHGYLFQTVADLGLIGLAANLLLLVAWAVAAGRTTGLTQSRWRAGSFDPERVGLLTLTSIVLIFGVHSAVDWTWFVPGTCVTALLCAAWVAGRGGHRVAALPAQQASPPLRERLRAGSRNRLGLLAAGMTVVLALSFAWATWQPLRSVAAGNHSLDLLAAGRVPAARQAAQRARDLDPLSIDPLLDLNIVESRAGRRAAAREALEAAVALQPQNPNSWLTIAEYDLQAGNGAQSLKELGAALYLDPRSTQGVTLFLQASRATGRTPVVPGTAKPQAPPAAATP